MKKGILMEIDDTYLTLLTPSGEFLYARKQNQPYTIGEEILFFPIEKTIRNSNFSISKLFKIKPLPAILVALILFLGSFIPMYETNKAYAYMSIDVNPSIELGINKKMQVVKLTAYNHDGKKIISHIDNWKKEPVSQLAQLILNEMKKQGYLKENHVIIISTVRIEKTEKPTEKRLTQSMNEIKQTVKENHLKLTVLTGSEDDMEQAHHLGITTGKYQENKILSSNKNKNPKKSVKQQNNKNIVNPVAEIHQPADIPNKQNNRDVQAPIIKENKNNSYNKKEVFSRQGKQGKEKTSEQDRTVKEKGDSDKEKPHSVNHGHSNEPLKSEWDEHDHDKYDQHHSK